MYYIRTADKLQRTARWAEDLDEKFVDAIEHLREVIRVSTPPELLPSAIEDMSPSLVVICAE